MFVARRIMSCALLLTCVSLLPGSAARHSVYVSRPKEAGALIEEAAANVDRKLE
jgi:hypothetical protein